jgi:hypothetical protein
MTDVSFDKRQAAGYTYAEGGSMTPQDTFLTFCERFRTTAGKVALRNYEGIIHAYPMRGFDQKKIKVSMGFPMCKLDIRFMAAAAAPTADAPTCSDCLAAMRKALGRN